MIKHWLGILLLPVFFVFFSSALIAQNTTTSTQNSSDTSVKQIHNNSYLKPAALMIPGTFLLYGGLKSFVDGIASIDDDIMNSVRTHHGNFHTNAADYLMWVPSASLYVMDAFHVHTAHNFHEHLILDAGSMVVTGALGYGMRIISRNIKAYNTDGTKFPSGHTANAFRGAEIIHQELKYTQPFLSYSGYVVATSVGLLRIYDKDHLLSEVLAGAGLGILSAKLTYWIFYKVKYKITSR